MVFVYLLQLLHLRNYDTIMKLIELLEAALHAAASIIVSVVINTPRVVM